MGPSRERVDTERPIRDGMVGTARHEPASSFARRALCNVGGPLLLVGFVDHRFEFFGVPLDGQHDCSLLTPFR